MVFGGARGASLSFILITGRMYGFNASIITVGMSRVLKTGFSATGDRRLYAFPLEAHVGYLDRKRPFLSRDEEAADLINEELTDTFSSY